MNTFIESLNQWGEVLLNFAGPMLWQSSLLIMLILVLDRFFARRIRAAVRYAFWLVVLVKLVLPPALALPTGAAWWLRTVKPVMPIVATSTAVTYGSDSSPMDAVPASAASLPLPPMKLDGAGWCLLVASLVGVALLFWMLGRWWQVAQIVRRARDMEQLNLELKEKLISAQHVAVGRSPVRLKITEDRMSPAVCGLFRPVILLPRLLVEQLSAGQLRAVLLHELTHLRRADVWVNCAQALLQIAYWWHPLVWLANARIRRVREEAVDDAVMLALRHEAEIYAPTLLEVVKLAWRRPLMSLGLVGIMESRSALRQRIERLTDFRIARKTGLTLASVCALFVFSAVALPMGEAPVPVPVFVADNLSPATISTSSEVTTNARPPAVFVKASIYQMSPAELRNLVSNLSTDQNGIGPDAWWSASPRQFALLKVILKNRSPISSPRIQTSSGQPAEMYVGTGTNGIGFDCLPIIVPAGQINLVVKGEVIAGIKTLLATNRFQANAVVENSGGLVVRAERGNDPGADSYVVIMNVQILTNALADGKIVLSPKHNTPSGIFMRTFKLTDPILANVRPAAGWGTNNPAAEISQRFKKLFTQAGVNLESPKGKSVFYNQRLGLLFVKATEPDLHIAERIIMWYNHPASAVNYHYDSLADETNSLLAPVAPGVFANSNFLAALNQLQKQHPGLQPYGSSNLNEVREVVSNMGHEINRLDEKYALAPLPAASVRPQIHIKGRFFEAPEGSLARIPRFAGITGNPTNQWIDILTSKELKTVLHDLETNPGIKILGEPEGVTSSGRQMAMHATELITVITNFAYQEITTNGVRSSMVVPQMTQIETGPILDTASRVMPDGRTINLKTVATVTSFLGYRRPTIPTRPAYTALGEEVDLPVILPSFEQKLMTENLDLKDGQTLVLGGLVSSQTVEMSDEVPILGDIPLLRHLFQKHSQSVQNKDLLVLITVTIVDSAGNPVHPHDTMAWAQDPVLPP